MDTIRRLGFFFLMLVVFPATILSQPLQRYEVESRHMGTRFRIVLYAPDDSTARAASDSAFRYITQLDRILSDYKPGSELNRLTRQSGTGRFLPVSASLFEVVSRAVAVSEQTGGAFDITVGPFVRRWREIKQSDSPALPDKEDMKKLKQRVGYHYLRIDSTGRRIALERDGMQLDAGGIAKGYAADEVLRTLETFGIRHALVDAGGDIVTGKPPPGSEGWHVRIPVRHETPDDSDFITLILSGQAVATSGDLFQYVEIDGRRYSHIIDPETGLGLTDRSMVSVVAPDGMTADSYASAVSVLGADKGIEFIRKNPDMGVRIEYIRNDTVMVRECPVFRQWPRE